MEKVKRFKLIIVCRNFNRKGKNHNHEGYYSEQGVWQNGDDNIRFVGRRNKELGINVGEGFLDAERAAVPATCFKNIVFLANTQCLS